MKIEGQTIQKGIPTPDNPIEIINIYKDLDYAVKIVESIRNKVSRINVPEQNKVFDIPFLNSTESQALTTVLYKLSEYSEEINKLKEKILEKQDDVNVAIAQRDSMEYQFEQAKAEINKLNNVIDRIKDITRWLIIIPSRDKEGDYRPIKNTTAQECYKALAEIKEIMKEDK